VYGKLRWICASLLDMIILDRLEIPVLELGFCSCLASGGKDRRRSLRGGGVANSERALGRNGRSNGNDNKRHVYGAVAHAVTTQGWYRGHTSSAFDYTRSGRPPGL